MLVLAGVAGARVMLVLSQIPNSGAGAGSAISAFDYAATQGPVILRYFRLLLIPYGFTVDPQIAIETGWRSIAAWAAIVVAAAAAKWCRSIPAAFWFLAGLILLLPSSSIFPADDLAADRRLYLPLIAFATCAAFLLNRARPWLPAGAVILLAVLSLFRVQVWQTERSLWQEAVLRSPAKLRPKIQLSRALDSGPALELLETARQSFPDDASLAAELGRRYLEAGRSGDALREFGRALALAPRDPAAHNNRGVALMNLGQQEAARGDFERALELDPCFFDARYNLLQIGVRTDLPGGCRFSDRQELSFTKSSMER
jgi:tetratricopeptide (TPR) repeat protein